MSRCSHLMSSDKLSALYLIVTRLIHIQLTLTLFYISTVKKICGVSNWMKSAFLTSNTCQRYCLELFQWKNVQKQLISCKMLIILNIKFAIWNHEMPYYNYKYCRHPHNKKLSLRFPCLRTKIPLPNDHVVFS